MISNQLSLGCINDSPVSRPQDKQRLTSTSAGNDDSPHSSASSHSRRRRISPYSSPAPTAAGFSHTTETPSPSEPVEVTSKQQEHKLPVQPEQSLSHNRPTAVASCDEEEEEQRKLAILLGNYSVINSSGIVSPKPSESDSKSASASTPPSHSGSNNSDISSNSLDRGIRSDGETSVLNGEIGPTGGVVRVDGDGIGTTAKRERRSRERSEVGNSAASVSSSDSSSSEVSRATSRSRESRGRNRHASDDKLPSAAQQLQQSLGESPASRASSTRRQRPSSARMQSGGDDSKKTIARKTSPSSSPPDIELDEDDDDDEENEFDEGEEEEVSGSMEQSGVSAFSADDHQSTPQSQSLSRSKSARSLRSSAAVPAVEAGHPTLFSSKSVAKLTSMSQSYESPTTSKASQRLAQHASLSLAVDTSASMDESTETASRSTYSFQESPSPMAGSYQHTRAYPMMGSVESKGTMGDADIDGDDGDDDSSRTSAISQGRTSAHHVRRLGRESPSPLIDDSEDDSSPPKDKVKSRAASAENGHTEGGPTTWDYEVEENEAASPPRPAVPPRRGKGNHVDVVVSSQQNSRQHYGASSPMNASTSGDFEASVSVSASVSYDGDLSQVNSPSHRQGVDRVDEEGGMSSKHEDTRDYDDDDDAFEIEEGDDDDDIEEIWEDDAEDQEESR